MGERDERLAQWARSEALRQAIVEAATTLAPHDIELMAVKGVYFAHAVGADITRRRMQDADAIVVRGSFARACRVLSDTGEWVGHEGWSAKVFVRTSAAGGSVDLHRLPLPPFFGGMRRSTLRMRAQRHEAFGQNVLLPDPDDAACLAIAHFVKDCCSASGRLKVGDDLHELSIRQGVCPTRVATRLVEHRLRRVALAAFTELAEGDSRWTPWLDALSPSRAERISTRAALRAVHRYASSHPDLAFLIVRTLGDDVSHSSLGFFATATRLLRDRAKRAWRTTTTP